MSQPILLPRRRTRRRWTSEEDSLLRQAIEERWPEKRLSKVFGRSRSGVQSRARRLGIEAPPRHPWKPCLKTGRNLTVATAGCRCEPCEERRAPRRLSRRIMCPSCGANLELRGGYRENRRSRIEVIP